MSLNGSRSPSLLGEFDEEELLELLFSFSGLLMKVISSKVGPCIDSNLSSNE